MSDPSNEFETLTESAKNGCAKSLGRLLHRYRSHLTLIARTSVSPHIHRKISPSDLVQETYCHALKSFEGFRGTTEEELLGWLRRILANRLANELRYLTAQRRDVRREYQLGAFVHGSSTNLRPIYGRESTPSSIVSRKEGKELLCRALKKIPSHYADIVTSRHIHGLPFAQIADDTGRTIDSVKAIWRRAICALKVALDEDGVK